MNFKTLLKRNSKVEKVKFNRCSLLLHLVLMIAISLLSACASQSSSDDTAAAAQLDSKAVASSVESQAASKSKNNKSSAPATESKSQTATESNLDAIPNMVEAIRVVESCKKEPYIKYEVQARESIKKGWEATKADKFGVGFRDADEYKKWSATHNIVYKKVSTACEELSKCAKKNDKERHKKCEQQAKRYSSWQKTAESFAQKIKLAETQPRSQRDRCHATSTQCQRLRCSEVR